MSEHLEQIEQQLARERAAHTQAEAELRRAAEETEERFRLALAAGSLGTWDYDPQTATLTCDNRFRDLFGVPHDAPLTTQTLMDAVHPDDHARLRAAVARSFDRTSGGSYHIEYRTIGACDRIERWISVRGRTFFDPAGRPIRFTGAALELTEQIRAQGQLREAQRDATIIADAVPQIVWTAGPDGVTDFCNLRWYEYTGLPAGLIGTDDWTRVTHPQDMAALEESWKTSVKQGTPFQAEVRLRRAADQTYRWHLSRAIPVKDEQGRVSRWVGTSTDIADQKRVEDITRFLGEASALLAESLDSDATLQTLCQLVVPRLADWCAIYLAESEDLSRYKLFLAHADPDRVRSAQELNEKYPPDRNASRGAFHVMRTGKPELYTDLPDSFLAEVAKDAKHLEILRATGIRSVMTVPITARGRTFGAITFVAAESGRRYQADDVTIAQTLAERTAHAVDNARLYAEAQEAVRVRDDFISIASHELKTPLTPLQLHLQSLKQQSFGPLPEKVVKKLEVMGRQVDRLERLVRSLVDISRVTGRRFEVEYEDIDLAEVLRDMGERFAPELERAKATLIVEAPRAIVGCWDRLRVEQVVGNLLSNAAKFGAGRAIEAQVTAAGGVATLRVRDHGIGIDAEDQARIFERFERAVPSRHYGGFGLGLWILRQIVDALGGTVSVESEVGSGSTFTVLLPQVKAAHAGDTREPRPH